MSASLARAALLLAAAERRESRDGIADARRAVREALDEVRSMMALVEGGAERWEAATAMIAAELEADARGFDVEVALDVANDGSCRLLSAVELHTLRRLLREGLTNALRHSSAREVRCSLRAMAGTVEIVVEDDGGGIAKPSEGRGLRIARRRVERLGGAASVEPGARGGSRLVARFPLELAVASSPPHDRGLNGRSEARAGSP